MNPAHEAPEGGAREGRIPTEFRYWDHIESRRARALRRGAKLVFGTDPVLPDEVVRSYAHSYYDADPVAEACVADTYLALGQARGRALLDRALARGIDAVPEAPGSMRALFAELERPPPWLDTARVEHGARVFRRYGTHLYSFAGAITLEGYRENSVARPLAFTGAYAGESANRRFLETAAFWVDVAEPGALGPGGRGRATALRVRLMHVFVRKKLLAHPAWDLAAWGVPISQGDALLTLMGGSFMPGYGLRLLGYRTTREEIESMMHFWRYVGHLMGVQPRWYPTRIEDAVGLMFTSIVKGVGASGEDGARLAHAYVDSYGPRREDTGWVALRKRFERAVQLGYVSWFVPAATRAHYGLGRAGVFALHPLLQAPAVFARETARAHSTRLDDWLDARVRASSRRWVESRLGARRAEYRAVEQFTR